MASIEMMIQTATDLQPIKKKPEKEKTRKAGLDKNILEEINNDATSR